MADPSPPDAAADHGALLHHLDGLYRVAQVVTPDATRAAHLVEATYRRAFSQRPPEGMADKTWLVELMLAVQAEQRSRLAPFEGPAAGAEHPPVQTTSPETLVGFRRRQRERFLAAALPVAFADLPDLDRRLLVLCEVENLPCDEAGALLAMDGGACAHLADARRRLRERLRAQATPVQLAAFGPGLTDDELGLALERMLDEELDAVPPTLRPTVEALGPASRPPAPAPAEAAPPQRRRWRRLVVTALIILTAGVLGYVVADLLEQEPQRNLIALSATMADEVAPAIETDDPQEAERIVRDELGWQLTLPGIEDARLSGVAFREVAPAVTVPVFLYASAGDGEAPLVLYVYTYRLLDRYADRIELAQDILRQIEGEGDFDLWDMGEQQVLVWRYRDDIFVAVTHGDAEALRERIFLPS